MKKIIQNILNLFSSPNVIYNSNTEWIVNFTYGGKEQMRIFQGESEDIVRKKFMSVRSSAQIVSVVCLNCA